MVTAKPWKYSIHQDNGMPCSCSLCYMFWGKKFSHKEKHANIFRIYFHKWNQIQWQCKFVYEYEKTNNKIWYANPQVTSFCLDLFLTKIAIKREKREIFFLQNLLIVKSVFDCSFILMFCCHVCRDVIMLVNMKLCRKNRFMFKMERFFFY